MSWNSMTKEFNIIIDTLAEGDIYYYQNNIMPKLYDRLNGLGCIYFGIMHDKDKDDKGNLKLPHFHLVILSPNRKRVSTTCYLVADILKDIMKLNVNYDLSCIQVSPCISLEMSVQYLTHKNDTSKYQYDFNNIRTNNLDLLKLYYTCEQVSAKCDVATLFKLVDEGYELEEFPFKIGLGNFQMYKSTIALFIEAKKFPSKWVKLQLLYENQNFSNQDLV